MTTTTCQICGRNIKANTGHIAHHGYRRPGDGWQTSSCFGALGLPYEQSCDRIDRYIRILEGNVSTLTSEIERLADDSATFKAKDRRASARTGRPVMVEMGPTDHLYAVRKGERISLLRSEVLSLGREIAYLTKRIKEWVRA
jgi:hypothetical protein